MLHGNSAKLLTGASLSSHIVFILTLLLVERQLPSELVAALAER